MSESANGGLEKMSAYERKAWDRLTHFDDGDPSVLSRVGGAANRGARVVGSGVRQALGVVPGSERIGAEVEAAMAKAMSGLHGVTVDRGLNSVKPKSVFKAFAGEGVDISSYDQISRLDLRLCDRSVPRKREGYMLIALTEGAASSVAVTGATVSATVSGGTTAVVAVGAIATDVTVLLVGMGRIVALVAAHYGYDVRETDEQVFASGVLAYSTAGNASEKTAALTSLSRLTQQMMRQATWKQLENNYLVKVIEGVFAALGFKLTKSKLAQAVPVAGAVINGGMNAHYVRNTFARAEHAYRLRFLTEKYNLDPSLWLKGLDQDVVPGTLDIPLADIILAEESAADETK